MRLTLVPSLLPAGATVGVAAPPVAGAIVGAERNAGADPVTKVLLIENSGSCVGK